jgi:hypothetical protein
MLLFFRYKIKQKSLLEDQKLDHFPKPQIFQQKKPRKYSYTTFIFHRLFLFFNWPLPRQASGVKWLQFLYVN